MELGPPLRVRFSEDEAAGLIKEAGFKTEVVKTSEPYHYTIIAQP